MRRNRNTRAAWASVLQTGAREDHQNKKEKPHRAAVCGGKLGPPTVLHAKHNITADADMYQGAMSPVFPFQSLLRGITGQSPDFKY